MSGSLTGSNADFSRNHYISESPAHSLFSNAASQSLNDLSGNSRTTPRKTYASDISNRLPSIVFSGPNGIYNRRVGQYDYNGEIGIGKASGLRSLNSAYITRGQDGILMNPRRRIPNEIGWSVQYFQNIYPHTLSNKYPGTKRIPR